MPRKRLVGWLAYIVWQIYMLKWLYLRDDFRRLTNHDKTWLLFSPKCTLTRWWRTYKPQFSWAISTQSYLTLLLHLPIEMQQIEYEQRSLTGLSNQVFRFLWRYSGSGRGSQEAWHILLGPFSGLAKREVETFLKREVDMSLEREVERRGVTRHW